MREAPYVTPVRIDLVRRDDGAILLSNPHPLRPAFANVVEPLAYWAQQAPDRLWLAGHEGGAWRHLTYRDGWTLVRSLATGLFGRFPRGSVIAIASSNSISHALLT